MQRIPDSPASGGESISLAQLADEASGAVAALRREVPPTPLVASPALSRLYGAEIWLKCDQMLPTGSFKYRGAFNKVARLSDDEKTKGVVTASTGNHGLAVASAGAARGVSVTVYASEGAAPAKLEAIRALGAEVILSPADQLTVELTARAAAEASGRTYISPYNDRDVAAGQGGIALEILDALPEVDAVVVSVGGGGLLAGVGAVLRARRPDVDVIAVWPKNAQSLLACIHAGEVTQVEESPTLSDATAGAVEPGAITVDLAIMIDPITECVSEAEIGEAMRELATREKLIVEGSAGVALAGVGKLRDRLKGKKVAVVLCGRNIGFDRFLDAIQGAVKVSGCKDS
jgi:threonine dehydratase